MTGKTTFRHAQYSLYLLLLLCLLSLIYPALSQAAGSIGVKPLTLDLELSPNKKGEFEIEIYSTSPNEDAVVHLTLFDALQKEDGSMDFVEVGKNPYSCAQWIKLAKSEITIPAGEIVQVKGEILVPATSSGSKTAAIMVETGSEKKVKGITIRVRYAVTLHLKVRGKPVIEQAELDRIGIKKLEDGSPAIEAVMVNKSEAVFTATGQVTLQDAAGRIVTSVHLTTESLERKKKVREKEEQKSKDLNRKKDENQKIFPGARVAFLGKVNKPLAPGEYTAMVALKYGRRSLSARQKIAITKDPAFASRVPADNQSFEVRPTNIEIKGQAGGVRSSVFTVTNLTQEPITITLSVKDLGYSPDGRTIVKEKGSTPYSSSNWIALQEMNYTIGPRLSQSIPFTITLPASAQPGDKYSLVVIEGTGNTGAQRIEKKQVEVITAIPGQVESTAEVATFKRSNGTGGKAEFALELRNKSPLHLVPKGRVIIRDMYNHEVEQIDLKLEARAILPQTTGRMTATTGRKLIPGKYLALAETDYGGKEKATAKINFTVK
ncbi:MAG: DUF916 domain-containing protein [bacterium]